MYSSDDEIIKRVQQGERAEYMELFERYYARIENYARRRLQNAESAKDVASETFLRAYRSIDSFRTGEKAPYLCYLLQICRRLVALENTRLRAAPTFSLDDSDPDSHRLADTSELPLAHLREKERRGIIQEALNCLPEDDQEIIHLAFERDLSRRDIGVILGKPSVSAVTSHLYRAIQKLKAIVVQQGYFASTREKGR